MKYFLTFICACFASATLLCAQDRSALEDSVIVAMSPNSLVEMLLENQKMAPEEILGVQWGFFQFMKESIGDNLNEFTDQELREILAYLTSDAYRFNTSQFFLTKFTENLINVMMHEFGSGPAVPYILDDKTYGEEGRGDFQFALNSVSSTIDALMERYSNGPAAKAMKQVFDNVYDIYLYTAVDYLSKKDLREMSAFASSSAGRRFLAIQDSASKSVESEAEKFWQEWTDEKMRDQESVRESRLQLARYIELSRSFGEYLPVVKRQNATIPWGKYSYSGQIRDLKPHGKGVLTDRKGVAYKGDFKHGKRHGVIEVTSPGKEPQVQYWVDDKYKKDIPVAAPADGTPAVTRYIDGNPIGYADIYDGQQERYFQGVFVDGALEGLGKITESSRVVYGEFSKGEFVNGMISWTDEENKVNEFRGQMSGRWSEGIRRWVAKDGSRTVKYMGTMKDGALEGRGTRSVIEEGNSVEQTGTFAFGKMYGEGSERRIASDAIHGINEVDEYKGGYMSDLFHGKGRYQISLTDIPEGKWVFTRCGVKMPSVQAKSIVIVMEGNFDAGSFTDGRISYSDGSWFEGTFSESGQVDGTMLIKYSDGSWYECEVREGRPHGQGVAHHPDGTVIKGKFNDGAYQDDVKEVVETARLDFKKQRKTFVYEDLPVEKGKVRLVKAAGVKIMVRGVSTIEITCEGRFEGDDLVNGKVTMSDGNWMEGTFEDGVLISGRGRSIDKYSTIYEGDIKNGFPHGEGKCTYLDGTWFKGKFANGNRMAGTHYTADGKVIKVYK